MKTVESMHMPHSLSDAAKTKIIRVLTPNLNYDYSGKNAFYLVLEFKGPLNNPSRQQLLSNLVPLFHMVFMCSQICCTRFKVVIIEVQV
jgi:hypothetical protein